MISQAEFLPGILKREMKTDKAKRGDLTEDVRQKREEIKFRRSQYIFHSHMLQSQGCPTPVDTAPCTDTSSDPWSTDRHTKVCPSVQPSKTTAQQPSATLPNVR